MPMAAAVPVWRGMAGFSNNAGLAGDHNSMAGRTESVMRPSARIMTYSCPDSCIPDEWKLPDRAAMREIQKVDGHSHGRLWPVSVSSSGSRLASELPADVSNLPRAAMQMIKKVDGHRNGRFWPVIASIPGSCQADSEDPSDIIIQSIKVPDTLKKPGSTEFSQSGDRPFRCRAAVTACPLPPRPGPLACSFLAESVNGDIVECSGRGCQPVYINVLAQYFQLIYTGASLREVDKDAVKNAFDASLECTTNDVQLVSEYASFTWRSLGDVHAADALYRKAINLTSQDPCVVEAYAFFVCSGLYCTLSCGLISECGLLVFLSRSARKA